MGKQNISRLLMLLNTVAFALVIANFDLTAAQDQPTQNSNANPNTQTTNTSRTRGSKSQRSKANSTAETKGVMPEQTTPAAESTQTTTTPAKKRGGKSRASMNTTSARAAQTESTDLSGTYTGTFNCDEAGLSGDTTLTVTGNQFTTADGKTGRIVASTTHGYTAVALQPETTTTGGTQSSTTASPVISLRAKKSGDRLTLSAVPGSGVRCSFVSSRGLAGNRRTRRSAQPAATGAEVGSPAEAGPVPTDTTISPTTRRGKARRGTARSTTGTPTTPSPTPAPTTSPVPAESPMPSPAPTESPMPLPTPSPSPTTSPTPAPTPSPTGSPTPSPTPSPTRKVDLGHKS